MRALALPLLLMAMLSVFCASLGAEPPAAGLAVNAPSAPLPQRLSDTGLYVANSMRVSADNIAFAPQYPLWSDGTSKRRWIYLPPGAAIDASRVDAWEFPVGTRLWKEFGYDRRVETRYIERFLEELPSRLRADRARAQRFVEFFTGTRLGAFHRWLDPKVRSRVTEDQAVLEILRPLDQFVASYA